MLRLQDNKWFKISKSLIITLNVIILSLHWYGISEEVELALWYVNSVFFVFYFLEFSVKITALR